MAQATTYTLASLDARVLDRLDGNTAFYRTQERYNAINEAIRCLNLFTGFLQSDVSFPLGTQPGRIFYDVPGSVIFAEAVILSDKPLKRSTIGALARRYRDWTTHTTTNFGPVADWMPMGLRKFALHPASMATGASLVISGVIEPTKLAAPTDSIQIPDEFLELLEEYAGYTLQLKEGGKIFADASALYQKFLRRMGELGRWRAMQQPRYFVEAVSVKEG